MSTSKCVELTPEEYRYLVALSMYTERLVTFAYLRGIYPNISMNHATCYVSDIVDHITAMQNSETMSGRDKKTCYEVTALTVGALCATWIEFRSNLQLQTDLETARVIEKALWETTNLLQGAAWMAAYR